MLKKLLILSIFLFTPFFAHAAGAGEVIVPFGAIKAQHANGTWTTYQATTSSDIGRGNALFYAVNNAANGDNLYLASSTYNLQGNSLTLGTKNISLYGSGKYSTIIQSTNATIISLDGTTGLTIRDLAVYGTAGGGAIQLPIAGQSSDITGVVIQNVYINNPSDGFYISMTSNNATSTLINVTTDTNWDSVYYTAKSGSLYIYNSVFNSIASSSINSKLNAHGILAAASNKGTIYVYNSVANARGAIETAGIRNDGVVGSSMIYAFNTNANALGAGAASQGRAIYANNGADIYVDGGYLQSSGTSVSLDLSGSSLNSIHVTSHTNYNVASTSGNSVIDYMDWSTMEWAFANNNDIRIGTTAARGVLDLNRVLKATGMTAVEGTPGNYNNGNGCTNTYTVYGYYTKNGTTFYTAGSAAAIAETGVAGSYYASLSWNSIFLATGYKVVASTPCYGITDGKATTTTNLFATPGDGSETSWNATTVITPATVGPNFMVDAWNGFTGIGTSSPYAQLSVVGSTGVVAEKYSATSTTATSTFSGRIQINDFASTSQLSVSGSATSTFTAGIKVLTGCFSVNGTCIGGGASVLGGTNGMLTAWTGATTLTATGTPTFAALYATSTTATSTFLGKVTVGTTTDRMNGNETFVISGVPNSNTTYATTQNCLVRIVHGLNGDSTLPNKNDGLCFGVDNQTIHFGGSWGLQAYYGGGLVTPLALNWMGGNVVLNGGVGSSLADVPVSVLSNSGQNAIMKIQATGGAVNGIAGIAFQNYSVTDTYFKGFMGFKSPEGCGFCRGQLMFALDPTGDGSNAKDNLVNDTRLMLNNTGTGRGEGGVASTSPWATWSVEMEAAANTPAFVVSNSGSTTPAFLIGNVNQNGYIGVGTSSPYAKFSITPAQGDIPFIIATTSSNLASTTLFGIDQNGTHITGGSIPTVSCAATCKLDGHSNDQHGTVNISGVQTSVTVTFGTAKPWTPVCVISDSSTAATADISSLSTTAFTATFSASIGTASVYYICEN